ncbi:MAG: folylpolyglutamate synthase/dihydrofolate synthase family protein [Clostridia bacterium]
MNYKQAEEYIHSKLIFGSKPGLKRISALLDKLNNPQNDLKVIHIAGTNGKGSTATFISNILIEAGYKTGLYLSPYVYEFKERISYNRTLISNDDFAKTITYIKPFVESLDESPTEFEILTAAALLYYKEIHCDFVILETGLGGRFDATNVIKSPLCSIITSISLDHMQYLGNTIKEIAFEKSGIIKEGCETISYPLQVKEAISEIKASAISKHSKLIVPDISSLNNVLISDDTISFDYKETSHTLHTMAKYQVYNFVTAAECIRLLNEKKIINVSNDDIQKSLLKFYIPARLEYISKNPTIIIDGSHNQDGIKSLTTTLSDIIKGNKLITILGILEDKNYKNIIEQISSISDRIITITPTSERALQGEKSATIAKQFCNDAIYCEHFEDACYKALEYSKKEKAIILVTGSFTISNDIKNIFKKLNI